MRIALIHALKHSIAPIEAAFAQSWPQARLMNLLDDSLSADLARGGRGLDAAMHERFQRLAQYAVDTGAEGILFTCSAFGSCIEAAARQHAPLPVLKPNEAMVEEAVHAGYPLDAAGVLLIELEGVKEAVEEQAEQVRQACEHCRSREFRVARSEQERQLLWKGRKNAFGAIGRVSPFYYVHDGVVPRTQIAPTLRQIGDISRRHELTIGNIFHAGDGNMHPIILFDARRPGDLHRAQAAGFEILEYCIRVGGSITGEHGIGMEKVHLMDQQFTAESLDMMRRIRTLFDPAQLFNPGKLLPARRGCAEIRQPPLIAGNPVY